MPSQTGYFDTLKSAAGKVFSFLSTITLTGTDGKTLTLTQDTSLDEAVAMSSKAPKASPTFTGVVTMPASVVIPDGGTIGQAAGPLVAFDDTNNYLEITGCKVGIGVTAPIHSLHVNGHIMMSPIADGTRCLLLDNTNTGTGKLLMQAGAGSNTYGGAINLYANAHATNPGSVVVGLSYNAEAKFRVNLAGLDGGTDLFTVLATGNVGIKKTNPATKLDVGGSMQVSSTVALTLGGYVRTFVEATGTPSGTTTYFDIAVNVPSGTKLLGCQLRVDTALTAGETWGAAYITGSTTAIAAAGQAVAKNTKVNKMHVDEITTGVTKVRITRDAGNFTDAVGVIRAVVYYETLTGMGDAA